MSAQNLETIISYVSFFGSIKMLDFVSKIVPGPANFNEATNKYLKQSMNLNL